MPYGRVRASYADWAAGLDGPGGGSMRRIRLALAAAVMGVSITGVAALPVLQLVTPVAACGSYFANVYDGASYGGAYYQICQGSSYSDLGSIGWDNRISSIDQILQTGHGFIYYTGPSYTDSSFKACGTQSYSSLSSTYNNAISSILATTSCPN